LKLAIECVRGIESTRRYRYLGLLDIFGLLHSDLSENSLSDIVAAVLAPSRNRCGRIVVLSLLKKYAPRVGDRFNRSDDLQVRVKREAVGDSSKVDLRIWTKGARGGDVVIDFEFKIGDGGETGHRTGLAQTEREWVDLQGFAKKHGIPSEHVVAFFVTRSGKTASSPHFIPLARSELYAFIVAALKNYAAGLQDEERAAVSALRWFFISPATN
jgi:hypothetical protein